MMIIKEARRRQVPNRHGFIPAFRLQRQGWQRGQGVREPALPMPIWEHIHLRLTTTCAWKPSGKLTTLKSWSPRRTHGSGKERQAELPGLIWSPGCLPFSNGDLQSLYDRSNGFYRRQLILTISGAPTGPVTILIWPRRQAANWKAFSLGLLKGYSGWCHHFCFTERFRARANWKQSGRTPTTCRFMEAQDYIRLTPKAKPAPGALRNLHRLVPENGFSPLKNRSWSSIVNEP